MMYIFIQVSHEDKLKEKILNIFSHELEFFWQIWTHHFNF